MVDTLADSHIRQLGTVGSQSIIKFGANIAITIAKQSYPLYVDIANFNRYDMIIGTPFIRKHSVLVDFKKNCVIIDDTILPAVRVELGEGNARLCRY